MSDTDKCPKCGGAWDGFFCGHCDYQPTRIEQDLRRQLADQGMKHLVEKEYTIARHTQFIDGLKAKLATAQAIIDKLPTVAYVKAALLANGMELHGGWDRESCSCDPSVGLEPCEYCATVRVLGPLLNAVEAADEAQQAKAGGETKP